jgi:putative holliday junction resolvase
MKYIAFDFGTKRTGVAVSDDDGVFAFPRGIIATDTQLFTAIFELARTQRPDAFVVGVPETVTGQKNENTRHIKKFISDLELQFGIPVHTVNEFGTSHHAKLQRNSLLGDRYDTASHRSIQKNHTDDAAAALILQRFLATLNQK